MATNANTLIELEALKNKVSVLEEQLALITESMEQNQLSRNSYTVKEVSQMLHCTPKTVYRMIDAGQLKTIKLGTTRVLASSLKGV